MYGSYAKLLYALLISAIKIYTQFMLEDKELRLNFTFQNSWVLSEKKDQKTNKINLLYDKSNDKKSGINITLPSFKAEDYRGKHMCSSMEL